MPVACQSCAPECPQAFGAQRLRGLRPPFFLCTSFVFVGADALIGPSPPQRKAPSTKRGLLAKV